MKLSHLKLLVDVVMTVAVVALMAPRATGLSLHEWSGVLISLVFFAHILLNWKWIACMTSKFFTRLPMKSRLNYCLDALLFVGFFLTVLSGMAIAKTIDFAWLPLPENMFLWRMLHGTAARLSFIGAGIHVGLHWKWVVCQFKRDDKVSCSTERLSQTGRGEMGIAPVEYLP